MSKKTPPPKKRKPKTQTSATLTHPEILFCRMWSQRRWFSYKPESLSKLICQKLLIKNKILQTTGQFLSNWGRFKPKLWVWISQKGLSNFLLNVSRKKSLPAGEQDTSLETLKHSLRISQGRTLRRYSQLTDRAWIQEQGPGRDILDFPRPQGFFLF